VKLKQVLEYLHGMLEEFLTLGANDIGMIKDGWMLCMPYTKI
jgi:hypothetical protein